MSLFNPLARAAGAFGFTLSDLSSRPLEELDEMGRELEEVENNLQWGFEPGRWADGAEYYRNAWPRAKLLGADAFAQSFDNRADLTAEAGAFKSMLGEAKMVRKTEAGLISPFLPALASLPNQERERVRNQTAKFRELVAFGVTPDRWRTGIEYMRDDGHLLDPDADTERLMGMYETRQDMLPPLDQTDHALNLLDDLDREDAEASNTRPIRDALNVLRLSTGRTPGALAAAAPVVAAPVIGDALLRQHRRAFQTPQTAIAGGSPTEVTNALYQPAGALDETRFEVGKNYRMPDGSPWRWNGRDLTPANPRAAARKDAAGAGDFDSGFTNLPTSLDGDAEYTGLQTQIGEAESKLAAKESLADAQEHALRREGVTPYESARVTGALREEAKTEAGELKILRARQAEIARPAPTTAAPFAPAMTDKDDAGLARHRK